MKTIKGIEAERMSSQFLPYCTEYLEWKLDIRCGLYFVRAEIGNHPNVLRTKHVHTRCMELLVDGHGSKSPNPNNCFQEWKTVQP